jgi:uncharacterized Zn finger protein
VTGAEPGGVIGSAGRPGPASQFGHSWWARAWVEALQQRAQLDPNRLPRGITYARSGNVDDLVIGPGEVRAQVGGREREPYQVRIRVRAFDDGQWAQVLDAIAARAAHAAAMLAGQLPEEVAADVADAGLNLLPGAGELGPRCTCLDEADPCKHAAAVCYLVARALDNDPFLVLLLRGRTRDEVLAGLRSRRRQPDAAGVASPAASYPGRSTGDQGSTLPDWGDEGLDARAVFALASTDPAPLPIPPLPPERPGRPSPLPLDLPLELAGLRADLLALATDAAHRAWDLATGASADGGMSLDPEADLARRANAVLGTTDFSQLAARSGVRERELARQALAWRHGGLPGFDTLRHRWDPAAEGEPGTAQLLHAAQATVRHASGLASRLRHDRITVAGLQLRLGRDYQWYPYRRIGSSWEPAGSPDPDPASALTLVLRP